MIFNGPRKTAALVAVAAMFMVSAANAVTITATVNPAGPLAPGQQFDVELSVSGWSAADGEVDAVEFNVEWDATRFSYVGGSGTVVSDGTEFLAQANQGGGYFADDVSLQFLNIYAFRVEDGSLGLGGSLGPSGDLGSFTLEVLALAPNGSGYIDVQAPAGGINQIFFDDAGFDIFTGGATLVDTSMIVIPEPSAVLLLAATGLLTLRRRRLA